MSETLSTPAEGVLELIRRVEAATASEELMLATRALASARDAAAAPCLVQVLGFNNPGAAVAAVDGLVALGAGAVEPILTQLDPRNYGARAWAVRALAGIGDLRGLELLEEALAQDVGPSVRRAAARGLGQLRLETLASEERHPIQERCLTALEAATRDGEWVVRYAVAVGLESLALDLPPRPVAGASSHPSRCVAALSRLAAPTGEEALVVRLRADLALQRLHGFRSPA